MDTDKYVERAVELIRRRIYDDPSWAPLSALPSGEWFRTASVAYQIFPVFVGSRALTLVEALLVEAREPQWGGLVTVGGVCGRALHTLRSDSRPVVEIRLTKDLDLTVRRQGDLVDVWGPEFPSESPDTKLDTQAGLTWRWVDADGETVVYVYFSTSLQGYGLDKNHQASYPEGMYWESYPTPDAAFEAAKSLRGIRMNPRKPDWRARGC
jgi:hypothetical protein